MGVWSASRRGTHIYKLVNGSVLLQCRNWRGRYAGHNSSSGDWPKPPPYEWTQTLARGRWTTSAVVVVDSQLTEDGKKKRSQRTEQAQSISGNSNNSWPPPRPEGTSIVVVRSWVGGVANADLPMSGTSLHSLQANCHVIGGGKPPPKHSASVCVCVCTWEKIEGSWKRKE